MSSSIAGEDSVLLFQEGAQSSTCWGAYEMWNAGVKCGFATFF